MMMDRIRFWCRIENGDKFLYITDGEELYLGCGLVIKYLNHGIKMVVLFIIHQVILNLKMLSDLMMKLCMVIIFGLIRIIVV